MAINRAQLVKELEPGLNALFGLEYSKYENQHEEIFDTEGSDRAFEEEVMLSGFGAAVGKAEAVAFLMTQRRKYGLLVILTRLSLWRLLSLRKLSRTICTTSCLLVTPRHLLAL